MILVSAILVVNLSRSIWDGWRRRDILTEREAALQRLTEENKRLQAELEYAQSPAFIEREARNRLGLGREGEAVVLLPNDKLQTANESTGEKTHENLPNWKKWWTLFF